MDPGPLADFSDHYFYRASQAREHGGAVAAAVGTY